MSLGWNRVAPQSKSDWRLDLRGPATDASIGHEGDILGTVDDDVAVADGVDDVVVQGDVVVIGQCSLAALAVALLLVGVNPLGLKLGPLGSLFGRLPSLDFGLGTSVGLVGASVAVLLALLLGH